MSTSGSFNNKGTAYNVSEILTPEYTLDPVKYAAYSPLYLSTTFALAYGLSFAGIIAVVVHTALYHGQDIWFKLRASRTEGADIHQRMMLKYRQAPTMVVSVTPVQGEKAFDYLLIQSSPRFAVSFLVFFALGFVTCYVWDTHLTWWAFIVAILISAFFYLPIGIVQATTNVQLGLNVVSPIALPSHRYDSKPVL